jgi:hypothetical protein
MKTTIAVVALCLAVAGTAAAQSEPARRRVPAPAPPSAPVVDTTVLPPQEIGTVAVGETRSGVLEAGDWTMNDGTWADVWYVNATAGQRLVIELRSRAFDAYLQFLDPWGAMMADNDDGSGMGSDSRITVTVREAGRYQIVVNAFGDTPHGGRYTLSVR